MNNNNEIFGRIYLITNIVNGKKYVGQTIRTINERWSGHKCDANNRDRDTALCNAIRKYGDNNFKIEILEDNVPYEKLDYLEIKYIEEYDTVCPNGYNISYGGQAFRSEKDRIEMSNRVKGENNPMYGMNGELNPFYNKKHSIQTRAVLSIKGQQRWNNLSDEEKRIESNKLNEMRLKMIEKHGGGFKGRRHSDESKLAMSKKLKGREFSEEHCRKISENNTRVQRVVMISLDGLFLNEFNTMKEACNYLIENNISKKAKSNSMSTVCKSRGNRTLYGYFWLYSDDYKNKNYDLKTKFKSKPRRVKCLNNGRVYNSYTEASRDTGCNAGGIMNCCKGDYKSCVDRNGVKFCWEFYDLETI